jgi:hypothetical protein
LLSELSNFGLDIVYVARQIGCDLLKRPTFLKCCAQFGQIKVGPESLAAEGCLHQSFLPIGIERDPIDGLSSVNRLTQIMFQGGEIFYLVAAARIAIKVA